MTTKVVSSPTESLLRRPSSSCARLSKKITGPKGKPMIITIESGNISKITAGANQGRIGIIIQVETHAGSHDIVRLKDTAGNTFATRAKNVFVIGKGSKSYISLPKGRGVKLSAAEERDRRLAKKDGKKKN